VGVSSGHVAAAQLMIAVCVSLGLLVEQDCLMASRLAIGRTVALFIGLSFPIRLHKHAVIVKPTL